MMKDVHGRQVMPQTGGCLRSVHRCMATGDAAAWPGFPKHAEQLASNSSLQRIFSDKVHAFAEAYIVVSKPRADG